MTTFLYSYAKISEGANALKEALGLRKIKQERSAFKGSASKIVINWGSSELPSEVEKSKVINPSKAVSNASDKLKTFNILADAGVSIPDYTTDPKTAYDWATKGIVVARKKLRASSGDGIVLMTKDDPKSLVKAPLYTKYIPKLDEYRVHVVGKEVIDYQKKALRKGWVEEHGPANYKIRNLANGFVYIRGEVKPPKDVLDQSIRAIQALKLDFGAVDVIWNEKQNKAYVLEVNTAPGLEGQTVDSYAKALEKII